MSYMPRMIAQVMIMQNVLWPCKYTLLPTIMCVPVDGYVLACSH